MLKFQVLGKPVAQGEPVPVAKGKLVHDTRKGLKVWRAAIMLEAITAAEGHPVMVYQKQVTVHGRKIMQPIKVCFDCPVAVFATFWFRAPGSVGMNYNPKIKTSKPDLDKLYRAVGDSLSQAHIISDDQRFVGWPAHPAKYHAIEPGMRCAVLSNSEASGPEWLEAQEYIHTPPSKDEMG
jgi:Holliday junction resolvase RusA-like endonuclease